MLVLCDCRSNKLECPAKVLVSGIAEPNALVVQSVNTQHTCSVADNYFAYPQIRKMIPREEQTTVGTLMDSNVSASKIAVYLHNKGLTNITKKDVPNMRAKLRHSWSPEQADEVCMCH